MLIPGFEILQNTSRGPQILEVGWSWVAFGNCPKGIGWCCSRYFLSSFSLRKDSHSAVLQALAGRAAEAEATVATCDGGGRFSQCNMAKYNIPRTKL